MKIWYHVRTDFIRVTGDGSRTDLDYLAVLDLVLRLTQIFWRFGSSFVRFLPHWFGSRVPGLNLSKYWNTLGIYKEYLQWGRINSTKKSSLRNGLNKKWSEKIQINQCFSAK